ncbi:MAG: peptide chain release factor N(5)-glutamine methyltransferase [Planctomycetota bacterium]|nr:MAG: peptide chain release factor N(5)-glutamine methyltransferase [Planctomycetota bacterium]
MTLEIWTIKKLLEWVTCYFEGRGIDSPRLSAELLLCFVLGLERIQLYTLYDRVVSPPQLAALRALVKRAGEQEPIAYLVGRCEFYSLPLTITPDCLIPRPETEHLVEKAILFLRQRTGTQLVLDLCTGSGCIAAAVAKNVTDAHIVATDICDAALKVAAANIEKLQLTEKVQLLCGDLFDPIIDGLDEVRFDLIISNPPYVSEPEYKTLDKNVKEYEPKHALIAGADGLDVYKRIAEKVDNFLKPDGSLMMEIGYVQGPAIKKLLVNTGTFKTTTIEKDPANNDRIAIATK